MAEKSIVCSHRYSKLVVRLQKTPSLPPTQLQTAHRLCFSRATALALADMHDSDMFSHWLMVAENSDGRFKTPRGAAFAFYYDHLLASPELWQNGGADCIER